MDIVIDIVVIKIGLLFIGLGFLVKSTPDLIAGYNTMPREKKENVDIKGLSTFMRKALIIMGLVLMTGFYLFKWLSILIIAESTGRKTIVNFRDEAKTERTYNDILNVINRP